MADTLTILDDGHDLDVVNGTGLYSVVTPANAPLPATNYLVDVCKVRVGPNSRLLQRAFSMTDGTMATRVYINGDWTDWDIGGATIPDHSNYAELDGGNTFTGAENDFSGGTVSVGVDDTTRGVINLYGGGAGEDGGGIFFYEGADDDGTVNDYSIEAVAGHLHFRQDNTNNASFFQSGDVSMSRLTGVLTLGVNDSQAGVLTVYGGGAGEAGGAIRLSNDADNDTTVGYYSIDATDGRLEIGRDGAPDITLDGAGDVGIGTTSPTGKLAVVQPNTEGEPIAFFTQSGGATTDITNDIEVNTFRPGVILTDASSAGGSSNFRMGVDAGEFIISIDTDKDDTRTSSAHYDDVPAALTIDSAGDVGIGITDPVTPLHLYRAAGDVGIFVSNSDNVSRSFFAFGEGTTSEAYSIGMYYDAGANAGGLYAKSGGSSLDVITYPRDGATLSLHANFSTRVHIDSAGDVGVGTTTPDTRLHVFEGSAGTVTANSDTNLTVENSANTGIQFLTPNTRTQYILFGDTESLAAGRIQYSHSNNTFYVFTNAVEALRIDSSGNVGIGGIPPDEKLHVAGDLRVANPSAFARIHIVGNDSSTDYSEIYDSGSGQLAIKNTGATKGLIDFNPIATDGAGDCQFRFFRSTTTTGTCQFVFYRGDGSTTNDHVIRAGTSGMVVALAKNGGTVGIGTGSPSTTLDVNGPVRHATYTVATLPAAGTVGAGTRAAVTDANSTTFHSTVASGGSNFVPVISDGTNWLIG